MKIGILTFPNSKSYGAALQMLALYKVCEELGYDVEIINYHNAWMKKERHYTSKPNFAKKILNDCLHCRMIRGFSGFENRMLKYPYKPISDKARLQTLSGRYQAVICGSDQVWNPDITNYDKSYFLDFCGENTARISYAPSFGVETLSSEFSREVSQELEKFHAISVREESGRRLVAQLTGYDAQIVLDPTLLMPGEQWESYETKHPKANGEYILYYTIRDSYTLWNRCRELSQKTGMKILRIGGNAVTKHFKRTDRVEYLPDVSPNEWLYLVHHASYVVTNSFHGTAFSVNYKKNFYVELSSLTNSRLSNILALLKLEDRIVNQEREIIPAPVDYSAADGILPACKEESICYLEKALKNVMMGNDNKDA